MPEELSELYQHSLRGAHPLGNRPLVTIIGMRAEPRPANVSAEQWDALVQEKVDQKRGYRDISTNSKVVEDPIAGHSVHLDDPDGVVTAIRDVLSAAISWHRLH
jgi:pimeloyl-ACP methyl ester carboxylesterase